MIQRLAFASLALAAGFALAGPAPALAQSSIKVVVNGQPITSYDISQRTKLRSLTGAKGGQKATINELIDERIQLYEATRRGISVPDTRVDDAYQNMAQGMKLSPSQLTQALGQQGVNAGTLKARIKAQMAWRELVQAKVSRETRAKAQDATAAMLAKGDTADMTTSEYMLQQIIFVVPKGSSAAYVAQRQREANSFRQRFPGCDGSIDQAKRLKDVVVRTIGRRDGTQLSGAMGKEIESTAVGKTTRPNRSDQGIDLIAVCSKRQIQSTSVATAKIGSQIAMEQGEKIGEDFLKELREKAVIQYR